LLHELVHPFMRLALALIPRLHLQLPGLYSRCSSPLRITFIHRPADITVFRTVFLNFKSYCKLYFSSCPFVPVYWRTLYLPSPISYPPPPKGKIFSALRFFPLVWLLPLQVLQLQLSTSCTSGLGFVENNSNLHIYCVHHLVSYTFGAIMLLSAVSKYPHQLPNKVVDFY
jgi:hypothetical protein